MNAKDGSEKSFEYIKKYVLVNATVFNSWFFFCI